MSKVQVIFPVSDFRHELELDLYEEISEDEIKSAIHGSVGKLYNNKLKVNWEGDDSKGQLVLVEKTEPYESKDEHGLTFTCRVFDLMLKGRKINYFFLRTYVEA